MHDVIFVLLTLAVFATFALIARGAPVDRPPRLASSAFGERVELRISDRGPGVPPSDWDTIFTPFQRLGDTDNTTGMGLGLALSRGLTEAMGGSLIPEETPGGGLTMVVALPAAAEPAAGAMPAKPAVSDPAEETARP